MQDRAKRRKAIVVDGLEKMATQGAEAVNIGLLTEGIRRGYSVLTAPLRFIFMPLAALTKSVDAGFAWWQAYLNGFEGHAIAKAVVETVGALAVIAATVGFFLLSVSYAALAPLVYAGVLAATGLFNAGSAIYLGTKAKYASDPAEKAEYKARAVAAAVDSVFGVVVGALVACVTVFAGPVATMAMGIAGAATWMSYLAWAYVRPFVTFGIIKASVQTQPEDIASENTNTTRLTMKKLNENSVDSTAVSTIGNVQTERREQPAAIPSAPSASDVDVVVANDEVRRMTL